MEGDCVMGVESLLCSWWVVSSSSPAKSAPFYFSPSKAPGSPLKSSELEGLNPSLIAKVKAKEAAAAKVEMTRSQQQIERMKMLKKLPKLARLVK